MSEEKTYSQIRNEFYEKYRTKIVPRVLCFEKERKTKLVIATIIASILTLIGLIIIFYIFLNELSGDASESLTKLAFILIGLACGAWYTIKRNFESKIKEKIMPIVCSCFDNLTWSEFLCDDGSIIKDSGVVPNFTGEDYDDIFTGSHRDVRIKIIESEFEIGSGKNRRTVFKGAIVRLDMNKNFSSHTVIAPDSIFHSAPVNGLRHTILEDTNFEKKYDVYTNDEVDARYLITPSFMERLKAIQTAFKADKFRCAFYKDYLFIALSCDKDLFSLCSLIKPVDDSQQYFQMFEEILSIIKLIDHFKLDQKIGL